MSINRRQFLLGAGAATAATAATSVAASPASAHAVMHALPTPEPIAGSVPIDPTDPDAGSIHWFLPGPEGTSTPVIGLPAMGLDVDPSTMTNFKGFNAYAVVAGSADASDGNSYDFEFDVRVMEGLYRGADGVERRGAFAFL